jgi:hypothetical protein
MNLISCDLIKLMREMLMVSQVDSSLQTEDNTYISNALTHCKLAKQFKLMGQYELNIFHFRKAAKIIDQLYMTRKEKYPEYQIMLAPFYFKVGDSLANYIELNTNEMGALKPLEIPEDPEDLQASQDEQDQVDVQK